MGIILTLAMINNPVLLGIEPLERAVINDEKISKI